MDALRELDAAWHCIGRIQANKTRAISERVNNVHTIDRDRVSRGLAPEEAAELAAAIARLPRLALRGLMTIPPAGLDERAASAYFEKLAKLRGTLENAGFSLSDLSMGMSDDFEAAIAAGATLVRL